MAKKQCSIVLDNELIEYLANNTAGNSLSARIDTALREYKTFKEENKSTGITQDLLTLTNTVQRITEYINKGNTKPVTNTEPEHETVPVKNKVKELGISDDFDDEDFDFELSEERRKRGRYFQG